MKNNVPSNLTLLLYTKIVATYASLNAPVETPRRTPLVRDTDSLPEHQGVQPEHEEQCSSDQVHGLLRDAGERDQSQANPDQHSTAETRANKSPGGKHKSVSEPTR